MSREHFHVHINDFSQRPPESIRALHAAGKFSLVQCHIDIEGRWEPLSIATAKFGTSGASGYAFKHTVDDLLLIGDVQGYVEHERLVSGHVARFQKDEYEPANAFPLSEPNLVEANRGADIHVFRKRNDPYDALERNLLDAGFYPVLTPGMRILTALYESPRDAEVDFHALRAHLATSGGATRIEMEHVIELRTTPYEFELRKVKRANLTEDRGRFDDLTIAGR